MADACGWCGEPAVTQVVTRTGRIHRKTAHVCERHAIQFEEQGLMTTRLEASNMLEINKPKKQWKRVSW